MRMSLNIFSSIACNSTIALNKQRQKHNILALTYGAILKGTHQSFKSLMGENQKTQMQTLTGMDKVVIEDYDHMTNNGWKCVSDEMSTSIAKFFSRPWGPLLYIYLYFKILNSLLKCTHFIIFWIGIYQ